MIPDIHRLVPPYRVSAIFGKEATIRDGGFLCLDEADSVRAHTLAYCQNFHYLQRAAANPNVAAILTRQELLEKLAPTEKAVVVSADPRLTFFEVYKAFHENGLNLPSIEPGVGRHCHIHATAYVSPNARLGDRVEVGANAVIEDFSIIADDVYIGPNAIIGAEGLISLRYQDGRLMTVKHSGGVQIGEGSQILAGAVIAKALFGSFTHIGGKCQIGILTTIGHGASVGDGTVVSGNCVVAGRTKIGRDVWIGASVSIAQGLQVGDRAQLKMGSVVVGHVDNDHVISGNFAMSHKTNMKDFLRKQRT